MMVYTLSQIMKGVHKYVAVPLKGGRFLYIGYFENSFLIAIESWHRQPILMLIGMEHVKHLYKSTASLFEAVFDQTSQTHFPKPGSMAYFLWEQNRIGQVGRS